MKKYLKPIIWAILLGIAFGYLFFKKDEEVLTKVMSTSEFITFVQVGVFKNNDNAINKQREFSNSIVIFDQDYYRVYIGIFKNKEIINKMKKIYELKKHDYYLKKVNIANKKFLEYLDNIEKLMLNTDDREALDTLSNEILNKYKEVIK